MARYLPDELPVKEDIQPTAGTVRLLRTASLVGALLAVGGRALAAPQEDPAEDPAASPVAPAEAAAPVFAEAQAESGPGWLDRLTALPVHGSLSTWFRGRWTPDDADADVRAALYLDVGDAEKNDYTAHLSALLYLDLDGQEIGRSPFFDITNTYDDALTGRLYEAYVDANRIDGLAIARVGRQQIYRTPELAWFDGAYVETEELTEHRLSFGAYGGIPVHVFESSPSGDALFGLYAAGRPWKGGRLRLDWMHFKDENLFGDHDTDLFDLGWWQTVGEALALEGEWGWIDDSSRDVRVMATYYDQGTDLKLQASYYELLNTQKDLALEVDPFYGVLLDLFPYYQTRFLVSKSLRDWIFLEGGFDIRRVTDEGDVGEFNRDFERYYAVTTFQDVAKQGFDVSVTGEVWNSDDSDVQTWGADVTKQIDERWDASVGTYYSLYKYDYFLVDERNNVRTYYVKMGYDPTKSLSFDMRYEFEDDEFEDYQTVRLGMSWRF